MSAKYREIELLCSIDIEQTQESFHAHAIPEDVEINPGDSILVHDAPATIGFGEIFTGTSRATLTRATLADRLWTKFRSYLDLTELFEVGFNPVDEAAMFSNPKG
jgi:hypothetical protein